MLSVKFSTIYEVESSKIEYFGHLNNVTYIPHAMYLIEISETIEYTF